MTGNFSVGVGPLKYVRYTYTQKMIHRKIWWNWGLVVHRATPPCPGNSAPTLPQRVGASRTVPPEEEHWAAVCRCRAPGRRCHGDGLTATRKEKGILGNSAPSITWSWASLAAGTIPTDRPYLLPSLKIQWPQNEFMRTCQCLLESPKNKYAYRQLYTSTSQALLSPNTLCPNLSLKEGYSFLCHPVLPHQPVLFRLLVVYKIRV